jgi:hypothetical protein
MHQLRPSYSYVHDIIDSGFNAATDTIISAKLVVDLRDDSTADPDELANFNVDGKNFGTFDVNFTSFTFNLDPGFISSFLNDGIVKVTVNRTLGDFQYRKSTLMIQAERKVGTSTVPEPATLLLFGLGSAAGTLSLARKKRQKQPSAA